MKKTGISYAIALLFVLSIASCAQNSTPNKNGIGEPIHLDVKEFSALLEATPEKQVIDVRTAGEFSSGHLKSAINYDIYASQFDTRIAELDKTKPVFVYCKGGGRSSDAAERMQKMGFTKIYNLTGGILAWTHQDLPLEQALADVPDTFTATDFDQLLKTHPAILIDFYGTWCEPCKRMAPSLDKLSKEYAGRVFIQRINVDEAKTLCKELKIESLPALATYKNQSAYQSAIGYQTEDQMRNLIEALLN